MPSEASIARSTDGSLALTGVLDYRTGPQLLEAGRRLIGETGARVQIDCRGVEHSSSVGLSLLLAYVRDARRAGKELSIVNLPDDMREIAKVSGILDILPLAS